MDISDTRKCNLWNLDRLADYLSVSSAVLRDYYEEISADAEFLAGINERLRDVRRDYGFTKAIFARDTIESADWFAFERILIYVLLRHLKPDAVLETGVYYGGNTSFLLAALHRNEKGKLVSIDLPDSAIRKAPPENTTERHPLVGDSELYEAVLKPGFIIPDYLKKRWEFVEGDSLAVIPTRSEQFDVYLHDSDHSMGFLTAELAAAWPRLSPQATVIVDDIDWSNAFFALCVTHQLSPVLFTDNGKDNLRVRSGIVKLDHPRNFEQAFTGKREI